jgi:hypothetical protein
MTKSDFVELATLRDPEGLGLIALINVKDKPNGYKSFSFALFKEFERGGATERTAFLNERHLGAARKLLDMVEKRIRAEQDKLHTQRRFA